MVLGGLEQLEIGSNLFLTSQNLCQQRREWESEGAKSYFDSGRNAIKMAIRYSGKRKKALLPIYICKSVIDAFSDVEEIEYYSVNKKFEINVQEIETKLREGVEILFLMSYWGRNFPEHEVEKIRRICDENQVYIIEDMTHSLLSNPTPMGNLRLCSLRKWFPIPNGAVIYGVEMEEPSIEDEEAGKVLEALILKGLQIEKGVECREKYRKRFVEYEHVLDVREDAMMISDVSKEILKHCDVESYKKKRRENTKYVLQNVRNDKLKFVFEETEIDSITPFCLPLYAENRDELRSYLMEHSVFCAVHWPLEAEEQMEDKTCVWIGKHILSIPIDQRYGEKEMKYLCEVLNQF